MTLRRLDALGSAKPGLLEPKRQLGDKRLSQPEWLPLEIAGLSGNAGWDRSGQSWQSPIGGKSRSNSYGSRVFRSLQRVTATPPLVMPAALPIKGDPNGSDT